jgi:hypothetical protein
MATINQVQADLNDLATAVNEFGPGLDRIAAVIQTLKDQVAAGDIISQEQLDGLSTQVQQVRTAAQAAVAREGSL